MEISEFDETLTTFETAFNVAGSTPFVAIVSGGLRAAAGKIQLLTGLVFGVAGLIGQLTSHNERKWENITHVGLENVKHGALNLIRGLAESIVGLTIVGSLVLLAAQLLSSNRFAPIFKYNMQGVQPVRSY